MRSLIRATIPLILLGVALGQGSLLLVGGGGEGYNDWSDTPYAWFVEQAGYGTIINIDASEVSDWYPGYFEHLGADEASHELRIRTRTEANDPEIADLIRAADGIFIEGGDQWPYVENWNGTLVEEAILEVFENGGAVGGTSAGLAVLGQVDFTAQYGSVLAPEPLENPCRTDMALSDIFLPLATGVLTDSHFHSRGRIGRLIPLLARWASDTGEWLMGMGVADNTAACLASDGTLTVWGEGSVTILYRDPDSVLDLACPPQAAFSLTTLHMDQLTEGHVYDLYSHTLLDGAGTLVPVLPDTLPVNYQAVYMDGSTDTAADLGEWKVTGLTGNLAAWYGNLNLVAGNGALPRTLIMPRIWHEYDEFENRVVGSLWAIGQHPGLTALWLDEGVTAAVSSDGVFTPNGQAWVLDSRHVSHAGFPDHRNTCYGGLIGLRIHILEAGMEYDLASHQLVSLDPGQPILPEQSRLEGKPNPFNGEVIILHPLASTEERTMRIFDYQGRLVRKLVPGEDGQTRWDGRDDFGNDLASGIYLVTLTHQGRALVCKLVLMK